MIKLEQLGMSNIRSAVMYMVVKGDVEAIRCDMYFNLLENFNIVNCQVLKDLIDAGEPHFDNSFFRNALNIVEKKLAKINLKDGIQPIIYTSTGYENSGIPKELLNRYDNCVSASDLVFISPITVYYKSKDALEKYSISKLKETLSLVNISSTISRPLENEFMILEPSFDRKGGPERLIRALELYEAQTLRQIAESSCPDCPRVFFENEEQKRSLAEYQAKDFVEYLVENADFTIWGEMTDTQKKKWLQIYQGKFDTQWQARENVERLMTNYATLTELEKGFIDSGAADRFILKPKGHL